MAKPTKQELLCTFLTTKKDLKKFTTPLRLSIASLPVKMVKFYFVGKNGSLRVGKNVSASISLTPNPKIFKQT